MNAETLAALGEPNRLRIVELLRAGPRPVNDIRGRLGLRQSQVSQHGLVEMEPRAQHRFYRRRARPPEATSQMARSLPANLGGAFRAAGRNRRGAKAKGEIGCG